MRGGIPFFFGGLIAVALLMLFGWSVYHMIQEVLAHCGHVEGQSPVDCQPPDTPLVQEGLIYVVTTVGGLVSALVIAVLSVTRPGGAPEMAGFSPTGRWTRRLTNGVVSLYLILWLIAGLSALVYGVMWYPGILPTLGDIGTTWLGLAVSATYAYFGLNPPAKTESADAEGPRTERTTGDLLLHQKVPNASEVASSGALVKRIKRTDPEFAQLVSNQNAQIIFKDEEGTGADRVMSARLMEKLDKLATTVTAEWSGVKLRVTEAWDEDGEHASTSLHYEGRAADLTVYPLDGDKLGRLGRLAVDVGFDWVYFEDSSHIHVSVRA
ncbi:MAG: hypothetical protein ABJE99_11280 [Roseobacter sp.]